MTKTYDIYWSPEGRKIATVEAKTAREAKRKTPMPWKRYLGEVYVVEYQDGVKCAFCDAPKDDGMPCAYCR